MERQYIVHSSKFFEGSPHIMILWCAGTQYSISIPLDTLVGTKFHLVYTRYLAEMSEKGGNGLPKHSPFRIFEALQNLVWSKCMSVFEAYATRETSERESLQGCIQPPTLHVTIAKDVCSEDDVIVKNVGDFPNSYPWDTSRAAHANSNITNSYGWGTAPVMGEKLYAGTTMQKFMASELFVTREATMAGQMHQVHTTTGTQLFFKPRLDHMAPEFDREVSVLSAIISYGLHRTLRVSPFQGLVLLDNGLVTGMLFEWLEGSPLAEHPELQNPRFHKIWREQVEAIVGELHRHKIIWGDVNVHNIFIDAHGNAWVIDFGGNCNVQFVDEDLKETYDGDRQGLRRIFEEWLPLRTRASDRGESVSLAN
jgi:serine/threonine protein kinase